MKLLCTTTLIDDFRNSSVFVDSTALIHASKSDDFLTLLTDMVGAGCTFYTVPSVVYEYTRTANNLKGYEERLEFIKELGIVVFNRIEELLLKDSKVFLAAYNTEFKKENGGPSYTDSILCTMVYKHRGSDSYVLTSNHKDMPLSMFDRKELITLDISGSFHIEALYQFSEEKFSKVLSKLESQEAKK